MSEEIQAGGSQPQQHGGQRNHRKEVHGALLEAHSDAPELLQASHQALSPLRWSTTPGTSERFTLGFELTSGGLPWTNMTRRVAAIGTAALVAMAVNFFGVVFFFRPIEESDSVGALPPPAIGFLIYVLLSVLVLDWAVQRFGQPVKVGLVIALSQIILVVDLVLRGERGVATGAAGSVLILVTWIAMGFAYGKARPDAKSAADETRATHGV